MTAAKKTAAPTKPAPAAKPAKAAAAEETRKPAKAAVKAAPVAQATVPAKGKGPAPKGKAAAAAKGADKNAKPEASDVDLSEIEADLEGEPVVDAAAKAKPLRMKVSRAKERALMREFGLD